MANTSAHKEVDVYTCELCKCTFGNDEKLKQEHFLGKKHQMILHNKHISQVKEQCSVFISGFPNAILRKNIIDFLSTFGSVVETFIGESNRFVIVQYRDAKVVELMLKSGIKYFGKNLIVRPRKLREQQETHVETEGEDYFEPLLEKLKTTTSFDSQLRLIMSTVQIPKTESHPKYMQLCKDLRDAIFQSFPNCDVIPFGSTVTGLDFKCSDVDAYVNYLPEYDPNSKEPRSTAYVKRARNALNKSRLFNNLVCIPKAKTPIVKCVHVPTNISCDFNFKNMLGVCNSKLIAYYMNLHPKIKPAMIVLKCWGKILDLVGTNGKLSSYSLTMMFIFFLQQPPFNFPPVHVLQMSVMPLNEENWNGSFNDRFKIAHLDLDCVSISKILQGFFKFYENFNYCLMVIAPFLGGPILKTEFMKINTLPTSYCLYKSNVINRSADELKVETPVCLQDPFELNHNTTRGVPIRYLEEFISFCRHGANLMQGENPSLHRLFTEEGDERKFKSNDQHCEFKIGMGSCLTYLECNIPTDCADKTKELRDAWFEGVNNFIVNVLMKVFYFDVNILKSAPNKKSMKKDGQTDVHNNRCDIVQLHCAGKYNFWETRKAITRDLVVPEDIHNVFEKQAFISKYMKNILLKGIELSEYVIQFNICINFMDNPIRAEIAIDKIDNAKNEFKSFTNFFAFRLPQWFEQNEKEKNTKVKTDVKTQ